MRFRLVGLLLTATLAGACVGADESAGTVPDAASTAPRSPSTAPPAAPAPTSATSTTLPATPPTSTPPTSAPPTSTVTTTPPITATTASPTSATPTTATVPASTAAPLPPRAAVWESAVDPGRINISANHPIGAADGIASGIDMVAVTPADADTALGRACIAVAEDTGVDAAQCLVVQFRFDVAAGFATDASAPRAELTRIRAVGADGVAVTSGYGKWALAGTADNNLTILLPGLGEGATVYWSTGSTLVGYTEFSGVVPGMIAPVDWLGQPPPTSAPPPTAAPTTAA